MSVQSGFSRRWQKVRRVTGRTPLRIKLITAVLALVVVALAAISIAGISVLHSYLLDQADTQLADSAETTQHTVSRCLSEPSSCPFYARGLTITWLPTGGPTQQIVLAAQNPFAMPSQQEPIPGPAIPDSQNGVDSIVGKPVTVPAVTGDGRWRILALPATASNHLTGQTTNIIIIGIDVSNIYSTLGALAIIDLILSGIVLVALAIVGIAIVRSSLRPLTD